MTSTRLPGTQVLQTSFEKLLLASDNQDLIKKYEAHLSVCESKFKLISKKLNAEIQREYQILNSKNITEGPLKSSLDKLERITKAIRKDPTIEEDSLPKSTPPTPPTPPSKPAPDLEKIESLAQKVAKEISLQPEDIINKKKEFQGIVNEGGNDCFLISCIQFLRSPFLRTYVLNQLPGKLYNLIESPRPSSTSIRKYLAQNEGFKKVMGGYHVARRDQLDAEEVFNFLKNLSEKQVIDKESFQNGAKAVLEKLVDPDYDSALTGPVRQNIKSSNYLLIKSFWTSLLFPLTIYKIIADGFMKFLDYLFNEDDDEDELDSLDEPIAPPAAQPGRLDLSERHPLYFPVRTDRWYDVSDVPEEYKSHVKFGDKNHQSECSDPASQITLPFNHELKSESLQSLADKYFSKCDQSDKTLIKTAESEIEVPSVYKEKYTLETTPSGLVLHFKRFGNDFKKVFTSISDPEKFSLRAGLHLKDDGESAEFHLKTFIVHIGIRAGSGHYICCRKEGDDWYYFNDGRSEIINEAAALRLAQHAYLSFYEKHPD